MSGFDRSTIRVLAGTCGNKMFNCLDLTNQRLGFGRELRQQSVQCLDLTNQRLGFWQGVAATKCSMSGFDRSTIRVLAGTCGNKVFNVWI